MTPQFRRTKMKKMKKIYSEACKDCEEILKKRPNCKGCEYKRIYQELNESASEREKRIRFESENCGCGAIRELHDMGLR